MGVVRLLRLQDVIGSWGKSRSFVAGLGFRVSGLGSSEDTMISLSITAAELDRTQV